MAYNKLILRTLNSPYVGDITRDAILSHDDVDSNFIHLKGIGILSASTSGGTNLVLTRYNGAQISVPINHFSVLTADTISATTIYGDGSNITGISGSTRYTNTAETPTTIGGIEAGSSFNNVSLQQMWDDLLYPYQEPAFSSFILNGYTSTRYEIGTDISTSQTFSWGTTNSSNVSASTIQISGYNLATLTGLANDGSEAVTFTGVVTRESGDGAGTRTWTIQGTNTQQDTFSRNNSIRWDWRMYWGQSSNTGLTESQLTGLTSNQLTPSTPLGTFSFPASGYKYFCYADDAGYSAPSSFVDNDTGFGVSMYGGYGNTENGFSYDLVSVTNSEGETINYRVYRTQNVLGGAVTIVIS
jgi:hypothetical protein